MCYWERVFLVPILLLNACGQPPVYPTEPPDWDSDAGNSSAVPCSGAGGAASSVTVQNRHGSTLELYWRDGACTETLYQVVFDGADVVQPTYLTHVWTLHEEGNGPLVEWFEVDEAPTQTVEVP